MIRLALLRHGHTTWNRAGRIQGRSDIPLDDAARAELAARKLPAPWDTADLCASPLIRAIETATLVGSMAPRPEPALMEMHWGDWEGREARAVRADPACDHRDIEDWGWNYTPPNGEPPQAVRDRVVPWAQALRRDTVAVCHIGVMRVLLAHASGWNFEGPAPFAIKRNRLFILAIDGDHWSALKGPVRLEQRAP